jgi:hypothetical protein
VKFVLAGPKQKKLLRSHQKTEEIKDKKLGAETKEDPDVVLS